MTYTVEQAMAVAMFNAGIKEAEGLIGLPTAKAKDVVRFLDQMGFDIDPSRHMAGHRPTPPLPPMILRDTDGLCTRKGCGQPVSKHEFGVFCP